MNGFDDFTVTLIGDDISKPAVIPMMMNEITKGDATIASLSDKFNIDKRAVTSFVSFLTEAGIYYT